MYYSIMLFNPYTLLCMYILGNQILSMMFSNFELSLGIINLSFCIDRYS